jgi:hypothetical protein
MKLPEYDSRPAPGTPLYDDPSDKGEAEDIKWFCRVVNQTAKFPPIRPAPLKLNGPFLPA